MGELRVSADLIEKGFFVYRNVSPNGPFDLFAYKKGLELKIEVRKGYRRKGDGTVAWGSKATDRCNHYAVYFKNEPTIVYIPELPA